MTRILIADSLEASGIAVLREAGTEVVELAAADRGRLKELLADFDALVVRSATKVTRELMAGARHLRVIGRAGIGVDNVDVAAATERGILVVNAPTANLMSATEHTFAMMLAVARNLPAADASMKRGEWDRKTFLGTELAGKTLGIVGFGRIGQRVAARARAFEMKTLAFDPYLDPALAARLEVELVPLDDLLAAADVVTLHTPFTKETKGLIDARRIGLLKRGAFVVNCGRGGILDEAALLAALEAGSVAGAALDVFEEEPTPRLDLVRHRRVVATPHIGAQTQEAQERIALETARMVLAALDGSMPAAAVNLPFAPTGKKSDPFLRLGERLGRLACELVGGTFSRLEVELAGLGDELLVPVAVAVAKGALEVILGDTVNYVNAEHLAAGRGIEVLRTVRREAVDYPNVVRVRVAGAGGEEGLSGTVFGAGDLRVVEFGGYRLEFQPEGKLLFVENRDVPGVVGKIGTALGQSGINISDIHLAPRPATGRALAVLRLEQPLSDAVRSRLEAAPEIERVRFVDLG
ncbi:MAG: phosphoglycerate dehydrogenase [Thermoanaerobaculia bacterium]